MSYAVGQSTRLGTSIVIELAVVEKRPKESLAFIKIVCSKLPLTGNWNVFVVRSITRSSAVSQSVPSLKSYPETASDISESQVTQAVRPSTPAESPVTTICSNKSG